MVTLKDPIERGLKVALHSRNEFHVIIKVTLKDPIERGLKAGIFSPKTIIFPVTLKDPIERGLKAIVRSKLPHRYPAVTLKDPIERGLKVSGLINFITGIFTLHSKTR